MIFLAPPDIRHDYGQLLRMAQKILGDRERNYPDLVEQGSMTEAAAEDGLRLARAIVADYQRIIALRGGQPAEAIDTTAHAFEKLATLHYVLQRSIMQRDAAIEDLRDRWTGSNVPALIDQGLMDWPVIMDCWRRELVGWKCDEVREYLSATRRVWAAEGLYRNACDWPWAMTYAEIQAELLAREHVAHAQAA